MDETLLERIGRSDFPLDTTIRADSLTLIDHRAVDCDKLFSASSRLVTQSPTAEVEQSLHAISWGLAVCLVILLMLYCYVIYRYRKPIGASIKAIFSLEDTFFIFENLSLEFKRFLYTAQLMVLLSLAVVVAGVLSGSISIGATSAGEGDLAVVGAILVYLYVSTLIQNAMRYVVSRFDSLSERLTMLRSLTLFDTAVISIAFTPLALIIAAVAQYWVVVWVVLGLLLVMHWIRLFIYFKFTGFSILQWFLYLCTLEVLPFTLLLSVASHYGSL